MFDPVAHGLIMPPTPPKRDLVPRDIPALIETLLADDPNKIMLVGRSGRLTAAQLDEQSLRLANALRSIGVKQGDRVAASMPNDTSIIVAFFAAMRLGAMWLGINRPLAPPEKAYMLRDSQTMVFIGDAAMSDQVLSQKSELPDLQRVIVCEPGTDRDEFVGFVAGGSTDPLNVKIDPLAPAAIAYTSGTTGFPKGAVHSQHNLLIPGVAASYRARQGSIPRTAILGVPLPFTILNLVVLGPLLAFQDGTPVVAMDRVDAIGMAEWIQREKVTNFSAVPAMVYDLLTNPEVTDEMLSSIDAIGVGGADMPEAFRRLYEQRFGRRVTTGYGLTEAPTSVTGEDPFSPAVANTCGPALPHLTVYILDENDNPVPTGEVGEVCVGPATTGDLADIYRPMLGYWNKPEASEKALRGGLLHTGDIGCLDEHGNLFIKDRKNDLIIRGGSNVYPAEVERVIHDMPSVAACAVIGVPDERLGEIVVAFVEPAPGATVEPADVQRHCAENLARYKVPAEVHVVAGFDRTPMGKIRKTTLRDSINRK